MIKSFSRRRSYRPTDLLEFKHEHPTYITSTSASTTISRALLSWDSSSYSGGSNNVYAYIASSSTSTEEGIFSNKDIFYNAVIVPDIYNFHYIFWGTTYVGSGVSRAYISGKNVQGIVKEVDMYATSIVCRNQKNLSGLTYENVRSLENVYLQNCRNLKYFLVSKLNALLPNFSSIIVDNCPLLEDVYMNGGIVDSIKSFSGCPNLKKFSARSNKITDASPLYGSKNLTFLDLGYNGITSFKMSYPSIKELNIQHNPIGEVVFSQNAPDLTIANFNNCLIPSMEGLSNSENIQTINGHINKMTTANFLFGKSKLQYANVSGNSIVSINLSGDTALSYFNCSSNSGLTTIGNLDTCKSMGQIDMNYVSVSDLNGISGCSQLKVINYMRSYSQLDNLDGISGCPNITILNLKVTPLSKFSYGINIPCYVDANMASSLFPSGETVDLRSLKYLNGNVSGTFAMTNYGKTKIKACINNYTSTLTNVYSPSFQYFIRCDDYEVDFEDGTITSGKTEYLSHLKEVLENYKTVSLSDGTILRVITSGSSSFVWYQFPYISGTADSSGKVSFSVDPDMYSVGSSESSFSSDDDGTFLHFEGYDYKIQSSGNPEVKYVTFLNKRLFLDEEGKCTINGNGIYASSTSINMYDIPQLSRFIRNSGQMYGIGGVFYSGMNYSSDMQDSIFSQKNYELSKFYVYKMKQWVLHDSYWPYYEYGIGGPLFSSDFLFYPTYAATSESYGAVSIQYRNAEMISFSKASTSHTMSAVVECDSDAAFFVMFNTDIRNFVADTKQRFEYDNGSAFTQTDDTEINPVEYSISANSEGKTSITITFINNEVSKYFSGYNNSTNIHLYIFLYEKNENSSYSNDSFANTKIYKFYHKA